MEGVRELINKIKDYVDVPSVVGFENLFFRHLEEDFKNLGVDVKREDNYLIVNPESKSGDVLVAHVDRHGLVVNDEGVVEYAGFYLDKKFGRKIKLPKTRYVDVGLRFLWEEVVAYDDKGIIIGEGGVKGFSYDFKSKSVLFNVENISGLSPGTPLAYKKSFVEDGCFIKTQLDNVVSVALAYQMVKEGFEGTVLLTAEEEIGRSWLYLDEAIKDYHVFKRLWVLDTTPYDLEYYIKKGKISLRKGDSCSKFDKKMIEEVVNVCESLNISYVFKDDQIRNLDPVIKRVGRFKTIGKTELGALLLNRPELRGCTVQIPTIYYHTNYETTSKLALSNYYKVMKSVLLKKII